MAIDRIARLAATPPALALRPGTAGTGPAAGQTLHLTLDQVLADDLLASTADGQSIKLVGLGAQGRGLAAGDVLLVKVLSTTPRLEVALFDGLPEPARTSGAPLEDEHAAMRFDQSALLHQVAVRRPDARALAASWRALALDAIERQAASRQPALRKIDAAAPPAAEDRAPPAVDAAAARQVRSSGAVDGWLLAALAWERPRLTLRVLVTQPRAHADGGEDDADPRPADLHRSVRFALQFELPLATLGRVSITLSLTAGGLSLDLAAESRAAGATLREAVPDLAAAVARAEQRLVRCRLRHGLPTPGGLPAAGLPPRGALVAGALPASLFRAAAELAVVLIALSPPCR